jgi:hypothetical protein
MTDDKKWQKPARADAPASASSRPGFSLEIERLGDLDLDGLRIAWRNVFAKMAPAHLPKHLLIRIIAYRLQACASGDVDRKVRQMLNRLLDQKDSDPSKRSKSIVLKPGTLLVREWSGDLHRVRVLENGFAWNGVTYGSLTKVAWAITGTRWNGPRFLDWQLSGLNAEMDNPKSDFQLIEKARREGRNQPQQRYDNACRSCCPLVVPWSPPNFRRKREVIAPSGQTGNIRPIRAEAQTKLVKAIAKSRVWLDEMVDGTVRDTDELALREKVTERSIRTLRLVNLPSHWEEQRRQLGHASKPVDLALPPL